MAMSLDILIKQFNYPIVHHEGKKYMNRASLTLSGSSFHWQVERDQYQNVPGLSETTYYFSHKELKLLVEAYQTLSEKEYETRARLEYELQEKIKNNRQRATSKQLVELFRNAQIEWETDPSIYFEDIVWRLIKQKYPPKGK